MTVFFLITALLSVFGLLALFALVMFALSFRSQKQYDEDSLPELEPKTTDVETPVSVFELEEDPLDTLDSMEDVLPLPEYETRQSVKEARRGMNRL